MTFLILSARQWWCESGEPIVWAFPDPFRVPLFEVSGINEHGKRKRGLPMRAMMQAGATPMRVSAWFSGGTEQADSRSRPSAVVHAESEDSSAVRLSGFDGKQPPGEHRGVLVATPKRLGMLEFVDEPEPSRDEIDAWLHTIGNQFKKLGPVYRLAEDFAGTMDSTVHSRPDFAHGERTQTPRIVEKAAVGTDKIIGYEVVDRTFARLGYEDENTVGRYLRITFTDRSRIDLALTPHQAQHLRNQLTQGGAPW